MSSGKRSAWKRRVREFCNYLLCLVLGGIFLFMGLTQPTYAEENTKEIYAESEKALMSSQECRLYPIPLLIGAGGTEFIPFSKTHLIQNKNKTKQAIIGGLGMRLLKSQSWKLMVRCVFHCVILTGGGIPAGYFSFRAAQHLPSALHLAHTTFSCHRLCRGNVKRRNERNGKRKNEIEATVSQLPKVRQLRPASTQQKRRLTPPFLCFTDPASDRRP